VTAGTPPSEHGTDPAVPGGHGAAPQPGRGAPDLRRVFAAWWPLAGSWLLMSLELPVVAAVMARLPEPDISLAAYGGVVFPLSLVIEGPVIMLLAASTALSRDRPSYLLIRRFMNGIGLALTLLHGAVAFTPLFDVVVGGLMGAPESIHEPARIGLRIMTPWTWAIAYRRFQQGVLIRHGRSGTVGMGTLSRLGTNILVLAAGYAVGGVPGIVVGSAAVAAGVTAEAVYVGLRVRSVLRERLRPEPEPGEELLTMGRFIAFYAPLALTPFITLAAQPISSAAISRMPLPVESLALIPVIHGVTFMFRSLGFAFNEVVVALLDLRGALLPLRKFALLLSVFGSSVLLLLTVTPLGRFYVGELSGLRPELTDLGLRAMWLVVPMPALSVAIHYFQGILVHGRRTMAVTEAVAVNFAAMVGLLALGVYFGGMTGLFVGLGAHLAGNLIQTAWLAHRSRSARRRLLALAGAATAPGRPARPVVTEGSEAD